MDFSSSQIVQSCMAVSPNIKSYFEEERYFAEVDQPEALTPHLAEIMAVNLLLDELAIIGVETNQTAEEISEYPTELNTVLDMRTVFDIENFYNLMSHMTEEQWSEFKAAVDECRNSGDLLFVVSEYCQEHFPVDERWTNILTSADHWWWSTDNFSKHVNALIEKVDRNTDPNKSVVDDSNVSDITKFLVNFQERQSKVKAFAEYVLTNSSISLNRTNLDRLVAEYDKEKLDPAKLPIFAEYSAHKADYKSEPSVVKEHHLHTPHHIEYWKEHTDKSITLEDVVMVVASLFLDGLKEKKMLECLSPIAELLKQTNPEGTKFLKYLVSLNFNDVTTENRDATVSE